MKEDLKRFRSLVTELGEAGRGRRYPAALRSLAVSYSLASRARGQNRGEIAEALGVCEATLVRWTEEREAVPVVPKLVEVVVSPSPSTGLTLATPSGYRVEGLSLSDVASLLSSLR